jgi:hypothetical protein
MSRRSFASSHNGTASKGKRLVMREVRRATKAERKAERTLARAARLEAGERGAPIDWTMTNGQN